VRQHDSYQGRIVPSDQLEAGNAFMTLSRGGIGGKLGTVELRQSVDGCRVAIAQRHRSTDALSLGVEAEREMPIS